MSSQVVYPGGGHVKGRHSIPSNQLQLLSQSRRVQRHHFNYAKSVTTFLAILAISEGSEAGAWEVSSEDTLRVTTSFCRIIFSCQPFLGQLKYRVVDELAHPVRASKVIAPDFPSGTIQKDCFGEDISA